MAFLVGVGIAWVIATRTSWLIDNSPAIKIHEQIVKTPIIGPDRTLMYQARYDRREHCDARGHYELAGQTASGDPIKFPQVQVRTYGTWSPGDNQTVLARLILPAHIPAGDYCAHWLYTYDCAGTLREQTIKSPPLCFKLRPDLSP